MKPQNNIFKHSANFIPERLKEARIINGYTVAELANKINVNRQTIYLYEAGEITPKSEVLDKIVDVLGLPLSYFMKEFHDCKDENRTTIFFRSLKSSDRIYRDAAQVRAKWIERAFKYLENYINYPKVNLPEFDRLIPFEPIEAEVIERIANRLREYWGIGYGPISNVIQLLEKNGFFIAKFKIGENKTDGFSYWINNRPYIFLASDKNCAVRTRFDAAHEIGHLILHWGIDKETLQDPKVLKRLESEANYFAAAFLLPGNSFSSEIISSSIDYFVTLKKRWKVSIAAMVCRCESLGLFTDNQITYLNKQISYRRWRKSEPLDDEFSPESPSLLKQSVNLLIKNKIKSALDFINELCIYPEVQEEVYCLESGILTNAVAQIPKLELRISNKNKGLSINQKSD